MIININWNTFRYTLGSEMVWFTEKEDKWEFYHNVSPSFILKCTIKKEGSLEDNMMFFEREVNGRANFLKCLSVEEKEVILKPDVIMEDIVEQKVDDGEDEILTGDEEEEDIIEQK